MDIRQLEVFTKVFELKSFSKAAEKLGISQPTVSAHVQHLEDSLGKRLFDRVGRKVIPTVEAKVLYRYAVEILRKREEAIAELLSLDSKSEGTLKIAASNIPGDFLIPHAIPEIRKLLSSTTVVVEILDSRKVVKLLTESIPEFDIGFVGIDILDHRLEKKKVMEDEIILIAPPSFKRSLISFTELAELPLFLREADSGTRASVEKALKDNGIRLSELKIVGILGSNTAIKEAVKKGAGFGLVSSYSVKEEVAYGKLKAVKVEGLEIKRCFYAIRRKDITPIPPARVLWENIDKLFNSSKI
ncbi:MAG: LysR family transcriptional regulator [Desulfurobacterium sp.]|nr:MAG: LysR family transcriptional regulator [Desulfurobacterium sp.]